MEKNETGEEDGDEEEDEEIVQLVFTSEFPSTVSLRFCRLSNDHKYFQYDDFAEKVEEKPPSADKLSNKVPVVDIKTLFTGMSCAPCVFTKIGGTDWGIPIHPD